MMKLCLLRSGSSGNCTLIQTAGSTVLLDAGGFSQERLLDLLTEADITIGAVDAVVVTHLHGDHINPAAMSLFRKHGIPVWVHFQNLPALQNKASRYRCSGASVNTFSDQLFSVKDIFFLPFLVDHDAEKTTCGFKFWEKDNAGRSVSFATDLGCFPDNLLSYFVNSTAVVLESNHDTNLLWNNPLRPMFHKKRVASDSGHLSNAQAAEALVKICTASREHPETIILSHLSKDHNSPLMALECVGRELKHCRFAGNLMSAYRDRKMECIEVV